MEKSTTNEFNNYWQPQLVSLIVLTIFLIIVSIIIYFKIKKQPKDKSPQGILLVTEMYVKGIEGMVKKNGSGKLNKISPYIFTLFTFLMFGNLMGLIAFEQPITSYSVALTLGIITWVGIYVAGIYFNKWKFFKKYTNPVELVGQFSPLLSITVRIFGNIIAGTTIMYLIYYFSAYIWSFIPVIGQLNILGSFMAPMFHAYFDIFGAIIQAYVFVSLTLAYWSGEIPEDSLIEDKKEDITLNEKNIKKFKEVKKQITKK